MINKCDPAYTNIGVKDLCEGTASNIDSFVPVSDPLSMITYRNIFCVYCNGVEGVPIFIDWYLQILSDNAVFLPNLNLLTDTESNRDNVLLIPPHYVMVQPCDPNFSYEISTCNETGLWKRYEEDIETACHSFIDPFNNTYKNYFCYLCNEDEPETEDLKCKRRVGVSDGALSTFAPVVTISDITGQQQSQKLECTGIEFPDENAVSTLTILLLMDSSYWFDTINLWDGPLYISRGIM